MPAISDAVHLDKTRIRRNFARAAPRYDAAAVLSREVLARLLERLDLVRLIPAQVLDAGSGTGLSSRAIAHRYPRARVTALDFSLPMLRQALQRRSWVDALWELLSKARVARVCADFEQLPVRNAAIDLLISNLALQWSNEPERAFREMHRVLRPGGLLMFSTLGPDTLKELVFASGEGAARGRGHPFIDMHDVGDLLVHTGFADPVMDMEYVTLTYARVDDLLRDLRATGCLSARVGPAGLRTPRWRRRLEQRYDELRSQGILPATFEIVYGHAWKSEQAPRHSADGRTIIRWDLPRRKL